jgi:hypothetical protein
MTASPTVANTAEGLSLSFGSAGSSAGGAAAAAVASAARSSDATVCLTLE